MAGSGGALNGMAGSVRTIRECGFYGNYVFYNQTSSNSCEQHEGAISSQDSVLLEQCRFSGNYVSYFNNGNSVSWAQGGAVSVWSYGGRMEGGGLEFHGNYALGYVASGGAAIATSNASIRLNNNTFAGNYASSIAEPSSGFARGGALTLKTGAAGTQACCLFAGNRTTAMTATSSEEEAVFNHSDTTLTLVNCSFYDHYASSSAPFRTLGRSNHELRTAFDRRQRAGQRFPRQPGAWFLFLNRRHFQCHPFAEFPQN